MSDTNYAKITWENLINNLLEQDIITKMSYDNWFKSSTGIEMDSKSLTVQTEDDFSMQWIHNNYKDVLETQLYNLLGQQVTIFFTIKKEEEPTMSQPDSLPAQDSQNVNTFFDTAIPSIQNAESVAFQQNTHAVSSHNMPQQLSKEQRQAASNINGKFTFENFVSGSNNQLAYNIALAISQNPGTSYNPMFLYGGSGLGKTHLIQAIGNHILDNDPTKKVLYVTSEAFLSDYVSSIRSETTAKFREKYRQIDVLIIDDIQFFVGKEGIQEEFFHTFNHLHQLNKQIIITSDSQPNELTTLTDRLRSRFSWGILTDMQAPELETRMAILHKKISSFAEAEDVPEEVIEYIASNIDTNVRDLEGALNGLFAHAIMLGKIDITLDLAVEALRSYTKKDSHNLTISKIQKAVAKYFHVTADELKSKLRKEPLATQRHITIYLCKQLTDNSLQKIGKQFGGRDHTTVMNSIKKVELLLKKDPDTKAVVDELRQLLSSK